MPKRLIVIGLLAVLAVTACGQQKTTTSSVAPVKLGVIMALTGSNAEILGVHHQEGMEIAAKLINEKGGINGRPLQLVYEDVPTLVTKDVLSAYYKLRTQDDVDAVLTTFYSGFLAIAPVAERDQVVVADIFDSSEDIAKAGTFAIGTGVYDEGIGQSAARFAWEKLQAKRAVVLYNTGEDFLLLSSRGFSEQFKKLGGEVVAYEGYAPDTSDFRSLLTKLKARDFDLLVPISFDEGGLIVRQAYELGMKKQIIGVDTMSTDGFIQNGSTALEGAYHTFFEPEASNLLNTLNENFEQVYGRQNDNVFFSALGFDGVNIFAAAMQKSSATRGRALLDAIQGLKDLPVVSGKFNLSTDGINRGFTENMLYQIKNGKSEFVEKR